MIRSVNEFYLPTRNRSACEENPRRLYDGRANLIYRDLSRRPNHFTVIITVAVEFLENGNDPALRDIKQISGNCSVQRSRSRSEMPSTQLINLDCTNRGFIKLIIILETRFSHITCS